jgi:predicted dehydrogenase
MEKINFGIIGTGLMAATMMEAFKLLPNVNVVAVASESAERANSFATRFNIAKAYASADGLLGDPSVQAVYIVNLTESHAATTIKALQAGKAVLCEKPIATSEADCKRIAEFAEKSGKLCMEAMWTHFLPAYQQLFALNQAKTLGQATQLYADFGYPTYSEAYPRLFKPSAGGGVLLDRGVYPIALAIQLFGNVHKISAQLTRNHEGVDTEAYLILTHENGKKSQLSTSIQSLQQNRAVLSFTAGAASLEPPVIGAEALSIQHVQPHKVSHQASLGLKEKIKQALKQSAFLRKLKSKKSQGSRHFYSYGKNQYVPVLTHFCALLQQGKRESDVIPLRFSNEVLRVIDFAKNIKD